MAVVKLFKGYGLNNAGEVAGFPDEVAAKLVGQGLAMYVQSAPVASVNKTMEAVTAEVVEEKTKKKKG